MYREMDGCASSLKMSQALDTTGKISVYSSSIMDIFNYSRHVLVNRSPFHNMFCSCLRFMVELVIIVETSLSEMDNFLRVGVRRNR